MDTRNQEADQAVALGHHWAVSGEQQLVLDLQLLLALQLRCSAYRTPSTTLACASVTACAGDWRARPCSNASKRHDASRCRQGQRSRSTCTCALCPVVQSSISSAPENQRPKVFVSSSAVGYYGASQTSSFTEDSPAGNDFLAEICKGG